MTQGSFFDDSVDHAVIRPTRRKRLRVLITVKAAPNPSASHGETVCVAGVLVGDVGAVRWVRLYPINFRHLSEGKFDKYDIVTVDCEPAREARLESWRPNMATLQVEAHLKPWGGRRTLLEPIIESSMCGMARAAAADPSSRSLALIRPRDVLGFNVERHPGWTRDEQLKIDAYVNQLELDLFGNQQDKTPLEPPRFRGYYRWRCGEPACRSHTQSIIDWEFVAHQRHLARLTDAELEVALRRRWFDEICAKDNDVAFYVGNQAKRPQTFSILGVYYPKRAG